MNMTLLTTSCVYMNGKVSVVFNRNCFLKINDFSRLYAPYRQSRRPYTVKVVVSKKWCKTDTLLLHTTNRYYMTCRFVPFYNGLEWPWRSFACCRSCKWKCNENISHGFNWHDASASEDNTKLLTRLPMAGHGAVCHLYSLMGRVPEIKTYWLIDWMVITWTV